VLAGGRLTIESGATVERETVESYFIVNSASFFVGWAWVVALRDIAAVSNQVGRLIG
jgi:hypothetical protein